MNKDFELSALRQISVVGGDVYHVLKKSDPTYVDFGEVYISFVDANSVKAWKCHSRMTVNLVVPIGKVRFVLRTEEGFVSIELGEQSYQRLTIRPGIWFGFQGIANEKSVVLNIADIEHDEEEVERCNVSQFSFDWTIT